MEKVALLIIFFICPSYQQSDFLLVAFGNTINRIDSESGNISVIHYVENQVENGTVEAVDFDIKHNCLFYSVSALAKIFQKCFVGNRTENVIVDNVNISGLSYDWTSELLYFISTNKIEIVKILHSENVDMSRNYMRRTIINGLDEEVSFKRDVVADPVNKYLFWTNKKFRNQAIYRSKLDGSDIKIFMNNSFVGQPTRLGIDYSSKRIYWLDEREYAIGSCDLNGASVEKWAKRSWNFVRTYPTMTEIGVTKNRVFLYEKSTRALYVGYSDNGYATIFYKDSRLLTALKFISSANPVKDFDAVEYCNCSHICFKNQDESFTCRCPDGMVLTATGECKCSNGGISRADGLCEGRVNDNEFYCSNRQRIPIRWVCNGYDSCEDGSDEQNC